MKIIGLTGGIASGKSTVRRMLEEHGGTVLDADAVYHELIAARDGAASPLALTIGERFPGILRDDGSVDRARLGARVFADLDERRALEAIAHPAVATEVGRRANELRAAGCRLMVYDVPLLYERGLQGGMDGVIVVWVPETLQLERLITRDGISETNARRRLDAQLPLEEKRRRATWVIDNSRDLDDTRSQVDRLWVELGTD